MGVELIFYLLGVLGLGFRSHSSIAKTIKNYEIPKEAFNAPLFSIFLSRFDYCKTSLLILGLPDTTMYSREITYEPLITINSKEVDWSIAMAYLRVGQGQPISLMPVMNALIDTGTSYIHLFEPIAKEVALAVGVEDLTTSIWRLPCSVRRRGPTLEFKSATGHKYQIPPSSYVLDPIFGSLCVLGILPTTDTEHFILGAVFLRDYISVYDSLGKRIGFAPAIHRDASSDGRLCVIC